MTSRNSSLLQKMMLAVVLSVLVVPVGVMAQDSPLTGCEGCTIARADVPSPPVGVLRHSAAREGARLALTLPTASQQPPPPLQRSWVVQHPLIAGALIGGVGGFVLGAVTAEGLYTPETVFGDRMLTGGALSAVGGGIGVATGWVVSLLTR